MFNISKVKRFELTDLVGRTLMVEKLSSNEHELIMAFDVKTNESFVLSSKQIPQCMDK